MKGIKIEWTDEMIATLIKEFPTEYNKVLAEKFGLGLRTVIRKARELGIEKESGFLDNRRTEISKMAADARPENSTKGMKGWCVPNSEQYRFKKGHKPTLTEDDYKNIHKKRNDTIRREKIRIRYGLQRLTKLNLVNVY